MTNSPISETDIVERLTPLEIELLTGTSSGWGSWMFECGEGLCARGLGRKENCSIYFDTPLAKRVIARLTTINTEAGAGE